MYFDCTLNYDDCIFVIGEFDMETSCVLFRGNCDHCIGLNMHLNAITNLIANLLGASLPAKCMPSLSPYNLSLEYCVKISSSSIKLDYSHDFFVIT